MALMVPAGYRAPVRFGVSALELPAPVLPEREREYSTLERPASRDPKSRVWLMLAGATLIFLGILPPSKS